MLLIHFVTCSQLTNPVLGLIQRSEALGDQLQLNASPPTQRPCCLRTSSDVRCRPCRGGGGSSRPVATPERRPPHPLTIDAAARFRARSGCPTEVVQLARTRLTTAPRHTWRTSMWLRSVAGSTPRRGHADPRPATPKGTTRKLAPGPNSATAPMSTKIFLALPTAGASTLYKEQPLSE